MKYLLADDDIDDRELFCEALKIANDTVVCNTVNDGERLLHFLKKNHAAPQLIFLDINMPVMNGWECLAVLKADAAWKQIPVIMISTSSHEQDISRARELGAAGFFTKPSNFDKLIEIFSALDITDPGDLKSAAGALKEIGVSVFG